MPHSESHSHTSRPSSQAERREKTSSSSRPSSASGGGPTSRPSSSTSYTKRKDGESSSSKTKNLSPSHVALREIAGDRVRHGKCPPEYLESIAHREDQQLKFIPGSEASAFFVKYLGGSLDNDTTSLRSTKTRAESQAIVFAVTVWDYDRKCVDYYMTWRGNSRHDLKEQEINFLNEEFRRVTRRLDKDYKRFRRAGSISSSTSRHSHKSSKRDRSRSPSHPRKSRPPDISTSSPHDDLRKPDGHDLGPIPEPPVSATSSVISLPYLNMVRGVPRGNRLPLMVTNPDRLSMLSEVDVPLADPDASAESDPASPPTIAVTPPDTHAPMHFDAHGGHSSGLTPLMKSSASIYSTESRSSRSSRSSQSDARDSPEMKEATLETPQRPPPEFLIVLLGDKLEKEGLSWHGMERQTSVRTQHRTFTKDHASPWIGPLAKADVAPPSRHPRKRKSHDNTDSDSDESYEENGWKDSPVVPLKPLLESLGFLSSPGPSSSPYPSTGPVIPSGYPLPPGSMVGSPDPSNMMQLGGYAGSNSTPRMSMNMNGTYVPAWMGHTHSTGSSAGSRPVSRVIPQMAYVTSPYMRPTY